MTNDLISIKIFDIIAVTAKIDFGAANRTPLES